MRSVALLILVSSCSQSDTISQANTIQSPQEAWTAIARQCGLASEAVSFAEPGHILFRPPAGAQYEAVECALREISANDQLKGLSMGFVGNEAFRSETD